MIIDGRVIAATSLTGPADDLRAYLQVCYPKAKIPPMSWTIPSARPMVARVNHGIWIASCECGAHGLPAPGCVVFLDYPLGWCVRCGNRQYGGFWRPIVVPSPDDRQMIGEILDLRKRVEDRNWEPGETVELLIAESYAHGDSAPDLDMIRIGPLHSPSARDLVTSFPPPEAMRRGLSSQGVTRGRFRRLLGM